MGENCFTYVILGVKNVNQCRQLKFHIVLCAYEVEIFVLSSCSFCMYYAYKNSRYFAKCLDRAHDMANVLMAPK